MYEDCLQIGVHIPLSLFFTCFCKNSRLNPDFSDKNGITLQPWCCLTPPFIPVNKQPTLSSASIFGITVVDFTIGINIHCNSNKRAVFHLGGKSSSPLASAKLASRLEIWFPGDGRGGGGGGGEGGEGGEG